MPTIPNHVNHSHKFMIQLGAMGKQVRVTHKLTRGQPCKYAPGHVLILASIVLPHLLAVVLVLSVLLSVMSLFSLLFLPVSIVCLLCVCCASVCCAGTHRAGVHCALCWHSCFALAFVEWVWHLSGGCGVCLCGSGAGGMRTLP